MIISIFNAILNTFSNYTLIIALFLSISGKRSDRPTT